MNKKPVCMCCTVTKKKKKQSLFDEFLHSFNYLDMTVNGEIHNAYNFYIIKNTVTIVPRGNFTKETIFNL